MRRVGMWVVGLCLLMGCRRAETPAAECAESEPTPAAAPRSHLDPAHGSRHAPLPVCHAPEGDPLFAARTHFDAGDFLGALSCASQAAAFDPMDADAHAERGAALSALERFEEAKLAYARLFALDPDHVDGLLGAAHLYAVLLPGSRGNDHLAALYAERGMRLTAADSDTRARFALVSAIAHNDLGQPHRALERAEEALRLMPDHPEGLHERALAHFERSEFEPAARDFLRLLEDPVAAASANHHLGLMLERQPGAEQQAEAYLERARALAPGHFRHPVELSPAVFRAAVERILAGLPSDMRADLEGVPVEIEEQPSEADLTGDQPPLSPMILGLYRGPPLGAPCPASDSQGPCRSIALYRRNLQRAALSPEDLIEQLEVTLLHEVGHLRGEDDHELEARGLD